MIAAATTAVEAAKTEPTDREPVRRVTSRQKRKNWIIPRWAHSYNIQPVPGNPFLYNSPETDQLLHSAVIINREARQVTYAREYVAAAFKIAMAAFKAEAHKPPAIPAVPELTDREPVGLKPTTPRTQWRSGVTPGPSSKDALLIIAVVIGIIGFIVQWFNPKVTPYRSPEFSAYCEQAGALAMEHYEDCLVR